MMKKQMILLFVCVMTILIVGCEVGQDTEPQGDARFVLGFSQLGSESGWRIGNTKSIKEAADLYQVDLLYLNAEQKYENQINHIRRFIANQVDIIAFSPIVSTGWDNVLIEAKEAGIPVIVTDRSVKVDDLTLITAFIGSDFVEEGRRAGKFLSDYYWDTTTPIKIVELRGTENSTPALGRTSGFYEAIEPFENMQVVYSVDGDFMNSRGREIMEDVLDAGIEFDVIYSHNDAMTYGVIEVLEAAGIQPGKEVVIISVDGEQASIDLLKQGKINCVIECTPLIGDQLMEISQKILAGEPVQKAVYSEETLFTMWDDLSELPPRGY